MPKNPKPAKTYGWTNVVEDHVDLTLPSGALVQVRRPDPAGLIGAGLLDEFDSATATVVNSTIPTAEGKPAAGVKADIPKLAKQLDAFNRILLHVVVQPTLVGKQDDEVEGENVWVGRVGLDDKTAIVAHATGGTASLQPFRPGPATPVGDVPDGD